MTRATELMHIRMWRSDSMPEETRADAARYTKGRLHWCRCGRLYWVRVHLRARGCVWCRTNGKRRRRSTR
jgi:hypothetical protein